MEFLMAVRTLIATTVMLFCSLWLARQLKIHRPRLPVSAVLILSLIMLFEPGMLAFLVWVVHDIASVNGATDDPRLHICQSFCRDLSAFYLSLDLVCQKLLCRKQTRDPQSTSLRDHSSGLETFIVVAVINLILLGLTYRFKPSNTPAP